MHESLVEAGNQPEVIPHTGPKRSTAYAFSTHTARGVDMAIHNFLKGGSVIHAVRKKHVMQDNTKTLVLQFHTPYNLEYLENFLSIDGCVALSNRSLIVVTEDDFESLETKLEGINDALKHRMRDPLVVGLIGAEKARYFLSTTRVRHTDVEGLVMGTHPNLIEKALRRLGLHARELKGKEPFWAYSLTGHSAIVAHRSKQAPADKKKVCAVALPNNKGWVEVSNKLEYYKKEGPMVFGKELSDDYTLSAMK